MRSFETIVEEMNTRFNQPVGAWFCLVLPETAGKCLILLDAKNGQEPRNINNFWMSLKHRLPADYVDNPSRAHLGDILAKFRCCLAKGAVAVAVVVVVAAAAVAVVVAVVAAAVAAEWAETEVVL